MLGSHRRRRSGYWEANTDVQKARSGEHGRRRAPDGRVQVLVISQHDDVRRQLVAYLDRSSSLRVGGDELSADAIIQARPAVLVLDLSQLGTDGLHLALGAAQAVGARVIALASIGDPLAERAVVAAGGLYRLKSAGADGLAEMVRDTAHVPPVAEPPFERIASPALPPAWPLPTRSG
jgi:DNA-binding NarL/FixJ family response regulator